MVKRPSCYGLVTLALVTATVRGIPAPAGGGWAHELLQQIMPVRTSWSSALAVQRYKEQVRPRECPEQITRPSCSTTESHSEPQNRSRIEERSIRICIAASWTSSTCPNQEIDHMTVSATKRWSRSHDDSELRVEIVLPGWAPTASPRSVAPIMDILASKAQPKAFIEQSIGLLQREAELVGT